MTPTRRPAMDSYGPWSRRFLMGLIAANVIGATLMLLSCVGLSDQAKLNQQVPWLSLAVIAVVLASTADVGWLIGGRRNLLIRRIDLLAPFVDAATPEAPAPWPSKEVVVVAGRPVLHRPSCLLVAGKITEPINVDEANAKPSRRCRVCEP